MGGYRNTYSTGLDAILFTAEGDMRHALNNLQASHSLAKFTKDGSGVVDQKTVFQVCDQPHPNIVRSVIDFAHKNDIDNAIENLRMLYDQGYSSSDLIGTLFKVTKAHATMPEGTKLEFLREIGFTHMRISNGVDSLLQLLGLVSRLCQVMEKEQNQQQQ
uniref:Replication factor C C-terminal domain-containing protein n=1 Tax=Craspedostauros australis TaxID=1486917 RepID=A0A7R9WT78_9STRA|mmetsp:Transcript_19855/g.55214  ORF Transcript_19855/g.55214 Transcript_19855/m.55214 type:complete len:160 (+) Transcript_19855:183-662(+)